MIDFKVYKRNASSQQSKISESDNSSAACKVSFEQSGSSSCGLVPSGLLA